MESVCPWTIYMLYPESLGISSLIPVSLITVCTCNASIPLYQPLSSQMASLTLSLSFSNLFFLHLHSLDKWDLTHLYLSANQQYEGVLFSASCTLSACFDPLLCFDDLLSTGLITWASLPKKIIKTDCFLKLLLRKHDIQGVHNRAHSDSIPAPYSTYSLLSGNKISWNNSYLF